ncbi:MAG: tetratricopeptide repeat protein [Acidobacteriota bacterium]
MGAVRHARGELRESLVDFAAARDLLGSASRRASRRCAYETTSSPRSAAPGRHPEVSVELALHIGEKSSTIPSAGTNALNRLAELHVLADELDLAEESFRGSLRIQRRMGDMHGAASSLVNLGAIARERGKYHQALQLANEAALIAEQAQDLGLKLTAQDAMVPGLTSLGRLGEALTLVKDVQSQSRAIGTNRVLASALLSASDCLLLIGDLEAAREKSLNALQMSREHGFAQLEWRALRLLCETEIERENYVQARKYLVTARTLQMSHEPRQKRDLDLLELRVTACEAGSAGLSKKEVKSLLRLAALGTPPFRIRVAQLLAQSLPPEEALLWIQLAYNQSKQLGHKDGIWRSAFRLSEVERALGKPDAASHRDEAIRTILSVAAFLGESLKEVYLDSFGRREILKSARVQKTG